MPTRTGMARHNDLIGHNTSPDRNKPNPSPNRPHAAEPTRKALVTRESNLSKVICSYCVVLASIACVYRVLWGNSP